MRAIQTHELGRRYGRRWALRGCTLAIEPGRTVALVGPNGAGKTTLLKLIAGLAMPSAGELSVFGAPPSQEPSALRRVGFLAQDVPLYGQLDVGDTMEMGRRMNPSWDGRVAAAHLDRLGLRPRDRVGDLSGGQRAQVALALALAKRPDLLLLDEPLASLDPAARRSFLQELMTAAAAREMTIVFSSHLIGDLERVCDHLVVLDHAKTLVSGDLEDVVNAHAVLTGPPADPSALPGVEEVIRQERTSRQTTALVRLAHRPFDPSWRVDPVGLEELILAYLDPDTARPTTSPLEVAR